MTSEDSPASHDWSWRALVLPFLFVFVTHGIIVRQAPLSTPFVKYNMAARTYLAGQMPLETLIDYSVAYFQLVAFIERLFYGSDRSFVLLTWLQVALVAASASLLFVALRRRFTLPLAALGVVAFAAQGHLMTAEQIFEPEVCLLFFLLGCIVAAGEKSPRAAAVAGIFASLALATRPTFVFIFLLAPAYYWVQGYRGRPLVQRSLLFLAPILIAFSALSLQAQRATGNWNAPRMSPGLVFYSGNNPISFGLNADYPPILIASLETSDQRADPAHAMSRSIATEDERRVLSIGEANDYWLRKSVDFIRDEPLRFGLTLWQKLVHSMGAYRWNDVPAARDHEVGQAPMGVLFSLIASLGLLGFLVELKNWKGALLFYVFAAAQLGVMILFYVSARHQTVLIPSLIYFSLATCERMARRDALSGLLLVTWLPLWGYLSVPDDLDSDGRHRQMGEVSLAAKVQQTRGLLGKLTLARRHEIAAEALATAPWLNERVYPIYYDLDGQSIEQAAAGILSANESRSPSDEFDLAFLEYLAGDWDSADDRFQRLSEAGRRFYRSYFQSSEPLYYRGRISVVRGDVAGGIKLLEAALESSPGDPWTLAELFVATGDVQYRERIERYFSGLDASWLIGRAQLYHGEYEAAERSFARLLPQVPNFRNGMLHHAVALGRSGQLDRGAGTLIDARGISEFPLYLPGEVVELAERWAAAYPGDVEVGIAAAGILVSHGHYDSALQTLEGLEDDRFGRVEGVRAGIRSRRGPGASTSGH